MRPVRNKYLSYDASRAPRVRAMFSRLAPRYDLVNDVMSFGLHRRWKRLTAERALGEGRRDGRPLRLLDLCCGTGDLVFLLERRAPAGTETIGVDFTLPMLAVARRRRRQSSSGAAFAQGDALALPFPDGRFDAITVGYGLRNVADPGAALAEMRRVLAPGGRAVILDFGKPENPLVSFLYRGYLFAMMAAMGLLFHGDTDTYLYIPHSLERYPAQRGVERLMREAGFATARCEERLLGTMSIHVGEK